uniref:Uncharacterized protein n=1 Tax=Arundo donax TaxID=35708 RepID=A0A0A8XX37_ARUDO
MPIASGYLIQPLFDYKSVQH